MELLIFVTTSFRIILINLDTKAVCREGLRLLFYAYILFLPGLTITLAFGMLKEIYLTRLSIIKARCGQKAFLLRLDKNDLVSKVNEKLCVAMLRQLEFENEAQCWGFIRAIIHNAAVDLKRQDKGYIELQIIDEDTWRQKSYQCDIDLKTVSRAIVAAMRNQLSAKNLIIFEDYFIADLKYQEIADKNRIPIDTVKGIIYRIREMANEKYGHLIKEIL